MHRQATRFLTVSIFFAATVIQAQTTDVQPVNSIEFTATPIQYWEIGEKSPVNIMSEWAKSHGLSWQVLLVNAAETTSIACVRIPHHQISIQVKYDSDSGEVSALRFGVGPIGNTACNAPLESIRLNDNGSYSLNMPTIKGVPAPIEIPVVPAEKSIREDGQANRRGVKAE